MNKISRRERILLGVFLALLLLYIVYQVWYTPFSAHKQELQNLRDTLQIQWQDVEGSIGEQAKLKAQLDKVSTDTIQLKQQTLASNDTSQFFQAVNTTAKQSNVSIEQIQSMADITRTMNTNANGNARSHSNANSNTNTSTNTTNAAATSTSQPSEVQFTIRGDYTSVVDFLNKMKQIPYAFAIQQGGMQFKENQAIISLMVSFPS